LRVAELAFGVFFVTLFFWVPAAWVFFDAEERGYSAYFWGALTLFFSLAAVIAYFIVRARRPAPAWPYSRGRIYFHVAVVTFWGLTMTAVYAAVWGVSRWAGATPTFVDDPSEGLRGSLAYAIGTALIAVPALGIHLALMRGQVTAAQGAAREILARLQSALAWLTVVFGGLTGLVSLLVLAYAVAGLAFDTGDTTRATWAFAVAGATTALVSLALTLAIFFVDPNFQRGRALLRAARPGAALPEAPAAPSEPVPVEAPRPAFCGACGARLAPDARFCAACGRPVA
jgi:hypothetical protein